MSTYRRLPPGEIDQASREFFFLVELKSYRSTIWWDLDVAKVENMGKGSLLDKILSCGILYQLCNLKVNCEMYFYCIVCTFLLNFVFFYQFNMNMYASQNSRQEVIDILPEKLSYFLLALVWKTHDLSAQYGYREVFGEVESKKNLAPKEVTESHGK